jgi:hypothetical protein
MPEDNGYVIVRVSTTGSVSVYGPATGGVYADMDAAQKDADGLANPDDDRLEIQGVLSAQGA